MYEKTNKNHKPMALAVVLMNLFLVGCNGGSNAADTPVGSNKANISTTSAADPVFNDPISFGSDKTALLTLFQKKTVTLSFSQVPDGEVKISAPRGVIVTPTTCSGSKSCVVDIMATQNYLGADDYGTIQADAVINGVAETAMLNVAINDPQATQAKISIVPHDYTIMAYGGVDRLFDVYYLAGKSGAASIQPAFSSKHSNSLIAPQTTIPSVLTSGAKFTLSLRAIQTSGISKRGEGFSIFDKTTSLRGDGNILLDNVGKVYFNSAEMAVVPGTRVVNNLVYLAPGVNSRAANNSLGVRLSAPNISLGDEKINLETDNCANQILNARHPTCSIAFAPGNTRGSHKAKSQIDAYSTIGYYAKDIGVKSSAADDGLQYTSTMVRTFNSDEIIMNPRDAMDNQFYLSKKANKLTKRILWNTPPDNMTETLSINSNSFNADSFAGDCLTSSLGNPAIPNAVSSCSLNFNFTQAGAGQVSFDAVAHSPYQDLPPGYDATIAPFTYTVLSNDLIRFEHTALQVTTGKDATMNLIYTGPNQAVNKPVKVTLKSLSPTIADVDTKSCNFQSVGDVCAVKFHTQQVADSAIISAAIGSEPNPVQFKVNVVAPVELSSLDFDGGDVVGAANGAHLTKKVKLTGTAGSTKLQVTADDGVTLDDDSSCITTPLAAGQECTVGFTVDEGKTLLSNKNITVSSEDNPKIIPAKLRVNILNGLGQVGMINQIGQDFKAEQYRATPGAGSLTIAARINPWLALSFLNSDYAKVVGSVTATGNAVIDNIACQGDSESGMSKTNVTLNAINVGQCTVAYHTTSIGDGSIKFNDFTAIGFNDSAFTFGYGDIPDFNIYTGNNGVTVKNPAGNGFAWTGGIVGGQERSFAVGVTDYIGTRTPENMLFAVRSIAGEVAGTAHYSCIFHVKAGDTVSTSGTTYNPHFYVNSNMISDSDCLNQISVSNVNAGQGSLSFNLSIPSGDAKNDLTLGKTYRMTLGSDQNKPSMLHVKAIMTSAYCDIPVVAGDNLVLGGWAAWHTKITANLNGKSVEKQYCYVP